MIYHIDWITPVLSLMAQIYFCVIFSWRHIINEKIANDKENDRKRKRTAPTQNTEEKRVTEIEKRERFGAKKTRMEKKDENRIQQQEKNAIKRKL